MNWAPTVSSPSPMPMPKWSAPYGICWAKMATRRRVRGGMLLLTVLGAALMLPPLVYVFDQPIAHFGIPQIVFYLFALWLALITGTALLTHALPPEDPGVDPGEGEH